LQLETGEDVFVHFSAIQMEGRRTLRKGQRVEFEVRDSTKGLCAENVVSGEAARYLDAGWSKDWADTAS
jgi:cold shock protein